MKNFEFIYRGQDGQHLNCYAKQVGYNDYEVYVIEKGVVLRCTADASGAVSCNLSTKRNLPWVDGISEEVENRISEQVSR